MRLLVLGGTAWLGAAVTRAAVAAGDDVTCVARGASGGVPEGAAWLRADRDAPGAYDDLGGEWDVVLDVARQPGQVRTAVAALAARTGHWVFVSSGNVYADHRESGTDEDAPLLPPLDSDVMTSMDTYGEAKVACEQHVRSVVGDERSLIARVGLIGGAGDVFDRSGYWPWRFARPATANGSVLVPDAPAQATQLIDVRDLTEWLLIAGRSGLAGAFNVTGPTVPLAEHLAIARAVAGHDGPVVSVDQQWLLDHGVQAWMGERSLPLWLDDPDWGGFNARDSSRAHAAGLVTRPLADTLADTLAWELSLPADRVRRAGLSDADERQLLGAWVGR